MVGLLFLSGLKDGEGTLGSVDGERALEGYNEMPVSRPEDQRVSYE
jgi:hypothetical protein